MNALPNDFVTRLVENAEHRVGNLAQDLRQKAIKQIRPNLKDAQVERIDDALYPTIKLQIIEHFEVSPEKIPHSEDEFDQRFLEMNATLAPQVLDLLTNEDTHLRFYARERVLKVFKQLKDLKKKGRVIENEDVYIFTVAKEWAKTFTDEEIDILMGYYASNKDLPTIKEDLNLPDSLEQLRDRIRTLWDRVFDLLNDGLL